ncbi:proteinaceous RNase P 1, chloroplastic/mitochondrial isoform X1 [Amborella trichopoda]|uniref:ribonuclease P n=1 Tax=Amborella trichopoda TaxID=13333 RepID=W1NSF2_AMBTC|nr:proteinaceous RNase P 1, chloroplastic/mitochondrial isoform X1 [Amborella trichopoda]ERM98613.1 hypothetical protein AMTR_s00109p00079620 [Amborella trichopoda]|eukprot:XP_020518325.1 proteinaceous RNase P 1, chloroplastic/mitochondrial isoform X1 [Amborella trichopoda]
MASSFSPLELKQPFHASLLLCKYPKALIHKTQHFPCLMHASSRVLTGNSSMFSLSRIYAKTLSGNLSIDSDECKTKLDFKAQTNKYLREKNLGFADDNTGSKNIGENKREKSLRFSELGIAEKNISNENSSKHGKQGGKNLEFAELGFAEKSIHRDNSKDNKRDKTLGLSTLGFREGKTRDKKSLKNEDGSVHLRARFDTINKNSKKKQREKNLGLSELGFSEQAKGGESTKKSKREITLQLSSSSSRERKTGAKKSERDKDGSVEFRVGLDMCSKKGNVLRALSLYDSALKEGAELKQYHYNVLLYLCSSAAMGLVTPAKSGSNKAQDKLLPSSLILGDSSLDMDKNGAVSLSKFDNSDINSQFSSQFPIESDISDTEDFEGFHKSESSSQFLGSFSKDLDSNSQSSNGFSEKMGRNESEKMKENLEEEGIRVPDEVKRYALSRGLEIFDKMKLEKVPLSEAALTAVARMAMSVNNGDLAFEMVKKMKELAITPRLRSYGPALFTFCKNREIDKAFEVETHMLDCVVFPEEPELEALLKLSVLEGRGEKVYYILHKLRTSVRQVSSSVAELIEQWFKGRAASRVGKRQWNRERIVQAMVNGGGGWHGQGWLGTGKWKAERTSVRHDGVCGSCGHKLVTIDIDPIETENFAKSVASIAANRERNSSFQNFQKWLDYYGPFEAVVDAANVGLMNQKRFLVSKVNAVVNGIRQKLPSKKWPLIIVHHRRIQGGKADEPADRKVIEKWKNADALYATPTGSNDDWYWLYAAIKYKCLIVTNDEMRDHIFQLLGNDFFPKWKERHQVHFTFQASGPVFQMPPPCSVVIQESEDGNWHIPFAREHDTERDQSWLCITRSMKDTSTKPQDNEACSQYKVSTGGVSTHTHSESKPDKRAYTKTMASLSSSAKISSNYLKILSEIEAAEKLGDCIIDFQI